MIYPLLFLLLNLFWLLYSVKLILFWLYTWQLKEYHLGRFWTYLRTVKGQKVLILNRLNIFKICLVIGWYGFFWYFYWAWFYLFLIPFFIYLIECGKVIYNLKKKRIIKPIFTKKIIFLFSVSVLVISLVLFSADKVTYFGEPTSFWAIPFFAFLYFLVLDLLIPLIVSLIVILFQPLTYFWRRRIIRQAKKKRAEFKNLIAIGVTGSYGKTSVKEFLYEILSGRFNVLKTKAHQNSEIGISRCILEELKPEHQVFIVEMGAYNRGGIKFLCDIAKPKIGILTGINEQHLATFGSQENIIKTKFELVESLPNDGIAILNADNDLVAQNAKLKAQNHSLKVKSLKHYSTIGQADIWAEEINVGREQILFKAVTKEGETANFQLNLFGKQNVINILLATQCARELGMSLAEIAEAAKRIKPEEGAMKLIKARNGLNILNATYSANPNGVLAHLEYLKLWSGKKMIIMPSLIELGKVSKEVHKKIGQKIAEVCDLAIITSADGVNAIKEGAGEKSRDIFFIESPEKIIRTVSENFQSGDMILLESRVPKELTNYLTSN